MPTYDENKVKLKYFTIKNVCPKMYSRNCWNFVIHILLITLQNYKTNFPYQNKRMTEKKKLAIFQGNIYLLFLCATNSYVQEEITIDTSSFNAIIFQHKQNPFHAFTSSIVNNISKW